MTVKVPNRVTVVFGPNSLCKLTCKIAVAQVNGGRAGYEYKRTGRGKDGIPLPCNLGKNTPFYCHRMWLVAKRIPDDRISVDE